MAVSMYAIAVPTFQKQLTALDAILDKATEYAAAKKIDISVLLAARLYPGYVQSHPSGAVGDGLCKGRSGATCRNSGSELSGHRDDNARDQSSVSPRHSHFLRT